MFGIGSGNIMRMDIIFEFEKTQFTEWDIFRFDEKFVKPLIKMREP